MYFLQEYSFAGVEHGRECYCGDKLDYDRYGKTQCTMRCTGNWSQKCGGHWAVDVYRTYLGQPKNDK